MWVSINYSQWRQVKDWAISKDTMKGTEVYGDKNKAWSIKYDDLEYTHIKVESGDKSFSKIYPKEEIQNGLSDIELLSDKNKMKEVNGVNIYVQLKNAENIELRLNKLNVKTGKVEVTKQKMDYEGKDRPYYVLFFQQDVSLEDANYMLKG